MKRLMLLVSILVVASVLLSACGTKEVEVTRVVTEKETVIEKETVVETVVEKETVVETVVEKETVVETVVEKETVLQTVVEKETVLQTVVEKETVLQTVVEKETVIETVVVAATPVPPTPVPQVPTEKQYGGTLNIWQPNGWPEVSWPHQSNWESRWAMSVMAEYLFQTLRDGTLDPQLAAGYEVSDDGLVYTVHLREGVKWHDGQSFTADDVMYSVHLWWNPELKPRVAPGAYGDLIKGIKAYIDGEAETIEGVKKVDDLTVEFTLDTPHPSFPRVLSANRFVVPKHALEKLDRESLLNGTAEYWTTNPIGTGAYKFVKYEPDQYIEFERYDDWWGGKPGPEKLFMKIASASVSLVMLENGELDFVTVVPPTEVEGLQENPNIETRVMLSKADAYGLMMNFYTMDGLWRNPKAKQALLYSLDRQGFIDSILAGQGKIANSIFYGSQYACPTMTEYDYNPEKADELWTELGLTREKRGEIAIDFMSWLGLKSRMDMLPVWQENMRALGFKANVDFIDNSLIANYRYSGEGPRGRDWDFHVLWTGWGGDPFGVFGNLDPESTRNWGYMGYPFEAGPDGMKDPDWVYENPRLSELKEMALKETDPEKLKAIFQEVDCIWNEEQPALQLVAPPSYEATSTRLQGIDYEKAAPLYRIGDWWIWEQE